MEYHHSVTLNGLMSRDSEHHLATKRETIRHHVLPEGRTQHHPQSCQKDLFGSVLFRANFWVQQPICRK